MFERFTSLERNQKIIISLGIVLVFYYAILFVIDLLDAPLEDVFNTYYMVSFLIVTSLQYLAMSSSDSRFANYKRSIWIVFLIFSLLTVFSYIFFNLDTLFELQPHFGTPILAILLAVSLIIERSPSESTA